MRDAADQSLSGALAHPAADAAPGGWATRGGVLPLHARRISLRANLVWTVFGLGAYGACQWLVIAGLARIGAPDLVGQYALAQAVVLPIVMFANLQLRIVLASDAARRFTFSDYLGFRVLTLMCAAVVLGGVSLAYRGDPVTLTTLLAMGLYRGVESLSDICCGLQQRSQRMDRMAISAIGRAVLAAAAVLALVGSGWPLSVGILGMAASAALVLLAYDLPRVRAELRAGLAGTLRPRFDRSVLKRLGRTAAPMGVIALFATLYANFPRYCIERLVGCYELGIFAAFMSALTGVYLLQAAMGQATLARLAELYAARRRRSYLRLATLIMFGAFGSAAMAVATAVLYGRPLIALVYSAEFAGYSNYLVWLSGVSALQCVVGALAFLLQTMRRFREAASGHVVAFLVTGGLAPWLIGRYGLDGAALAMGLGMFAALVWLSVRLAACWTRTDWTQPRFREPSIQRAPLSDEWTARRLAS